VGDRRRWGANERQEWTTTDLDAAVVSAIAEDASGPTSGLARNANFVLLWVGQFVSQVGDRLALVAFPWLIYQRTGSAMSTGAMLALYTLPYIFVGPFAGVVIDRGDKRRLLIVSDVVRAGLVAVVPLAAAWNLTAVYGLALLVASVNVFFDPCKLALLPDIVEERQLLRANSVLATGETLTEVVGYATAGFALAWVSTATAFRVDALTFLVSALAFLLMRYRQPLRESTEQAARSVRREIGEGLDFVRQHRGLLLNTLLVIAATLGIGATYPLTFFFAVDVLDGGTEAFGLFEASIAAGFLMGSLLLVGLGSRVPKGYAILGGLAVMGAAYAVVALTGVAWAACVAFAVAGVANAASLVAIDTYVQSIVPEALRGRVWTMRFTFTQGAYALSVLAGGALAGVADVRLLLALAGAIIAVPALLGFFSRTLREA
jgi:MFS family permease